MKVEIEKPYVKEFLMKLPKTSISTIASAVLVYGLAKGYVGPDEAILASAVMAALGVSINVYTKR